MQLVGKAQRKVLNQFVTLYQMIITFEIEKLGIEGIIKFNKKDSDDMLDDVNAKLIEVCEKKAQQYNLQLDKFQLSTICLDCFTEAVASLDEPFKIILKENKALIQDYLVKNKSKIETLNRIKKENDEYDRQYVQAKIENKKKANRVAVAEASEAVEEYVEDNKVQPKVVSKKKVARGTDSLAIDDFVLPMY